MGTKKKNKLYSKMKQFAISLFAAIAAAQSNFIEYSITSDGVTR